MVKVHAIFYILVLLFQLRVNLYRFPAILSYLSGIEFMISEIHFKAQ